MSEQDPVADYDKRMIAEFKSTEGESAKQKPNLSPWEKREDETAKSYATFVEYLKLGSSRSLAKLGEKLGKTTTHIQQWSSRFDWVRRAEAYDLEQDRIYFAELKQKRREMAIRHAKTAQRMHDAALKALQLKYGQEFEKMKPEDWTNPEIQRFLEAATKMERVALGEPSDIVEEQMTGGNHDGDRKPVVPLTFAGRIQQAVDLLETARTRASSTGTESSD